MWGRKMVKAIGKKGEREKGEREKGGREEDRRCKFDKGIYWVSAALKTVQKETKNKI